MNPERKMALVPGLLFIIATALSFVGDAILGSLPEGPAFLAALFANQARVGLAVVVKVLSAAASAGIAISLYPVLRRHSEGLALGAVCFRVIEAVFYLISALGLLSLVSLGHEYASAELPLGQQLVALGTMIKATRTWAGFVLGVISFCLGGGMYYVIFFRTRLVPRWLSVWGLLALASLLTMVICIMFGGKPEGLILVLAAPIALQELVLALWLILKGFNARALTSMVQGSGN